MRRFVRDNSLALVMFGLFFVFITLQALSGFLADNAERTQHGQTAQGFVEYLFSGAFVEATFENWESEFLQMSAYVLLTAWLVQKGSPESRKPPEEHSGSEPRPSAPGPEAPWPVRRGGIALKLYEHSLSLTLFALFLMSFALHALGGWSEYNEGQRMHGEAPVSLWSFVTSAEFWFQSMQNWQSEFLAIGVLAVLGIFLREKGSPESKPVDAPHSQTGSS